MKCDRKVTKLNVGLKARKKVFNKFVKAIQVCTIVEGHLSNLTDIFKNQRPDGFSSIKLQ